MAERPPITDDHSGRTEEKTKRSHPQDSMKEAVSRGLVRGAFAEGGYRSDLKMRYGSLAPVDDQNLRESSYGIEGDSVTAAVRRQKEREANQVQEGIKRYRKSEASLSENPSVRASQADTQPGRRLMREMLDALIPRIKDVQNQAVDRMQEKGGTEASKSAIVALLSLTAPPLALITARTAFTTIQLLRGEEGGGKRQEKRTTVLSEAVGRYVLQEKRFERRRDEEAGTLSADTDIFNFVELMRTRVDKPRPRQVN